MTVPSPLDKPSLVLSSYGSGRYDHGHSVSAALEITSDGSSSFVVIHSYCYISSVLLFYIKKHLHFFCKSRSLVK